MSAAAGTSARLFLDGTALGQVSSTAIAFFFLFIGVTMGITYWAAKKTRSASHFFTAGGGVTGFQNGLALAGDFMSAASFLGIAGLVATSGFDGLIYSVGWLVGWPIVTFLIAEPLRNLGKYTFADVLAYRLQQRPIRVAAASSGLAVIAFYLIAQMVGAGNLIMLMFGIPYVGAVLIVGVVMLGYVLFGGMIATTWVQIVKAVLLLGGAIILATLALIPFGLNPMALFEAAAQKYGNAALAPGKLVSNPVEAVSLGLALMFGTAGLPHILMRFYTVPNARAARTSVFYATGFIGLFYLVTFVLGFGASVHVGRDAITAADKGGNMAALLLADAVGGRGFFGFISAVAFATILAVVAGLTLSGAAALSHDLWVNVIKNGKADEAEQLRVAKYATVALGLFAMLLGLAFKGQNVAFMVGLAFAIAASANFPALLLSITWKNLTTKGAVASLWTGVGTAILLIVLSPTVMVDLLHAQAPIFPLKNPAIVTLPLSFLVAIIVSVLKPEPEAAAKFEETMRRVALGAPAEKPRPTTADVPVPKGAPAAEE
ncbi:MAG: sodium/solute symporter [Polyangiaceae bacterium]